ncbi:uncharacterized protein [Ptychodera flava]|uniref:uncharacterized protein n=1 Tax=Ptychodera flava TaxID=63121 RepID=UPI00396A32EA
MSTSRVFSRRLLEKLSKVTRAGSTANNAGKHDAITSRYADARTTARHISQTAVAHSGSSRGGEPESMHLPQIELPDYKEEEERLFRGLETTFPCLLRHDSSGPEPAYQKIVSGFKTYKYRKPFHLKYNNGVLPELDIAYETWGELNANKDNAVLIHAGLSASSHAKSHKDNRNPGWWEKFIGPGCAVDTDKFFVICTSNFGGCYGTTGPSSINPLTGEEYGTTFPIISVEDMVNTQFLLLDHLGIEKVHASIGSSLGAMTSLLLAALDQDRVCRVISISGAARSHPSSIALRYLQRRCIMTDPNWNKGHYYKGTYPKMGMKLAREIATIGFRSGPEWEHRFGRKKIDSGENPSLCPYFLIESYLDYQGESFAEKYDPNSLLYISKAVDMFDMAEGFSSMHAGLSRIKCPIMILGVQTDILYPVWQQRELADILKETGNEAVTYYEINSIYGHDTFLLDLSNVGAAVKGHLETDLKETGLTRDKKLKTEKKSVWEEWKSKDNDNTYYLKGPHSPPVIQRPSDEEGRVLEEDESFNSENIGVLEEDERLRVLQFQSQAADASVMGDGGVWNQWKEKDDFYLLKGPRN